MAKIHDFTGQQQQTQPQVDVTQSKPMLCEDCGHDTFISGTRFRTISKLLSGAPQDMIIPIDVFLCGDCGEVNKALYPKELQALDE